MSGSRIFKVFPSARRCRFTVDEILANAPLAPGVYQFLAFDEQGRERVLYVGWALPLGERTLRAALTAHFMGRKRPSREDLGKASPRVYFDCLARTDGDDPEDFKDIAGALIAKHSPPLNLSAPPPFSGRYSSVEISID